MGWEQANGEVRIDTELHKVKLTFREWYLLYRLEEFHTPKGGRFYSRLWV